MSILSMCQRFWRCLPLASLVFLTACATPARTNFLAGSALLAAAHAPTSNILQTYYLGVFDPREQLPPTLYRVRVQGQASPLSRVSFASGWVQSDLVDSLSGKVTADGAVVPADSSDSAKADAKRRRVAEDKEALNRRLVMFGPEGFREAPKNQRLVIVMGAKPEAFFSAIDRALGVVAGVTQDSKSGPDVMREIWPELARLREQRRGVQTMLDISAEESK